MKNKLNIPPHTTHYVKIDDGEYTWLAKDTIGAWCYVDDNGDGWRTHSNEFDFYDEHAHPVWELLQVGNRIKFPEDKYFWKVRAVDDRYAICTAYCCYTILDFKTGIRSSGTSWVLGHETDEQISMSMLALNGKHPTGETQELSRRQEVKLNILEIKQK